MPETCGIRDWVWSAWFVPVCWGATLYLYCKDPGVLQASSVPLSDIPEEWNAEAFPLVLALQQHALSAGEFRPVAGVLLALHGGKA